MSNRRIAVIGTGNVATHLIEWFEAAGFLVTSVYTRHPDEHSQSTFIIRDHLNYEEELCDFIVIATKDDAVAQVVAQLSNTGQAIILHTSGTVPLAVLERPDFAGTGILYPLQTLQKDRAITLDRVPFLIEGKTQGDLAAITALCDAVGINHSVASSEERLTYHVSAVISANFTNHLLFIAEKFLAGQQLNANILRPLMHETIQKAFELGALNSQTGPARRGDEQTLKRHIDLLKDPQVKQLYEIISNSILSTYRQ